MLSTFSAGHVGLVGPMMVGKGMLVTEAGGIIWNDGGAANYARGAAFGSHEVQIMLCERAPVVCCISSPSVPLTRVQVSYRRKVDYISAACVMFPKQYYLDAGGFDPLYGMGYYEDTDLAMTLASRGLDVVYQPLAVVSCMSQHLSSEEAAP